MSIFDDYDEQRALDDNYFISGLTTLVVAQRFDVAAQWLTRRHGADCILDFAIEEPGPRPNVLRWQIPTKDRTRFVFDVTLLNGLDTKKRLLQFHWLVPLMINYMRGGAARTGVVDVSIWDVGLGPGLCFCAAKNVDHQFLIPDNIFVSTRGYLSVRSEIEKTEVRWPDRKAIAIWRGSTTGYPEDSKVGWQSLPRIRLCEISRENPQMLDAGISSIVQISDPSALAWIERQGFARSPLPATLFMRYRYQIDIDGNTNSWSGLLQKLLTGSPVLKVASKFHQWYYDRLNPWVNYIPVAADMSDLIEKIEWLQAHDDTARRVGINGRALALAIDYESQLALSREIISDALEYFAERTEFHTVSSDRDCLKSG
jgi:Glycosyl transferase family 90